MKYRIDSRRPLQDEIRRIGNAEIDNAIEHLSRPHGGRHAAMHEARKCFKRLRGLLRLVQGCDSRACRGEIVRYRDVARTLAGPREATALVETVDRFIRDFPKKTAGGALDEIRANLVRRRDDIVHGRTDLETTLASAVTTCEAGRAAFAGLPLPDEPEAARELLASGAERIVRRARKALRHAGKRGTAEDFHELRKCVKTHWMHLLLLRDIWPEATPKRVKLADNLGERLGELNDIAVMRELVESEGGKLGTPEHIALFLKLMKRREKALSRWCIEKAHKLFAKRPAQARKQILRAEPPEIEKPEEDAVPAAPLPVAAE